MALGPKKMGEAIARNMQKKTGKTLEEWVDIVVASPITEKKEAMTFLKKEKGLGHFQAQRVFEELKGVNPYQNDAAFEGQIFDTAALKSLYDFFKAELLKVGEDVRIQPCRSYIPFYRKNQFAILSKSKEGVILGLNLPDDFVAEKFSRPCNLGSKRINAQAILQDPRDWDNHITQAVETAYKQN